jgi:hypothetical protein
MVTALPLAAGSGIVPTVMLQAHSILWNYLWVAPNLLLFSLALAFLFWKRGTRQFTAFLAFAFLGASGQLVVYLADVLPFVTAGTYWRINWANLVLEGILKFAVIAEIFGCVFGSYPHLARLGKLLIQVLGAVLVFAAALAAAYAPKYVFFEITTVANLLEQSVYFVESGLLLFIFVFASYFRLQWNRPIFGIALGLSISACVHLATWALMANGGMPNSKRILLIFLNMATYHVCVLIWFYYLLVPQKVTAKPAVPLPDHDLKMWNRELERLLQQ